LKRSGAGAGFNTPGPGPVSQYPAPPSPPNPVGIETLPPYLLPTGTDFPALP